MKTGKGILAVFLVLPLAVFGEVVFLDTGFENGNRDTQDLPDHAAWFATHSHTRVAQVNDLDGNYVLSINDYTQSTVRGALAYFTDVDNGVTNKVEVTGPGGAHTIRLSFDFMSPEAANDEDRGLRFVLMDSHVRKTADELSEDLTATGYMVSMNPSDGTLHFRTRNRDADPSNLLVGIGNWDNIESGQSVMGMTAGVWYNMTIDIERLFDDRVKLTATMTDGENTAVGVNYDTEYLNYTFDTVGISAAGTALEGRLEIDNLRVSLIGRVLPQDFLDWAAGFGLEGPDADPDLDFDGDGFTNWQEYIADTDPTSDSSFFAVESITREGSLSTVSYFSSLDREYELWFTPDLTAENEWERVEGPRMGVGDEDSMVHEQEEETASGFYRLQVSLPE